MVNFTSEIKRELLATFPSDVRCAKAALFALLITSGSLSEERLEFVSESERIAQYFLRLFESVYAVRPEINAAFDPKRERDKLTFSYKGEKTPIIFKEMAFSKRNFQSLTRQENCLVSFLRAAFLGGGSCTLPRGGAKTGYHLQIVTPSSAVADCFCDLFLRCELLAKVVMRGEKGVVYLKSEEALSDFFSIVGADSALRTLEGVTAAREESNRENRVNNCFAGNADKTAIASARQVIMLEKLKSSGKLSSLPEQLRQTAKDRMENPTLSLSELAEKTGISKSCLNHRMRKIEEIYRKTEETL